LPPQVVIKSFGLNRFVCSLGQLLNAVPNAVRAYGFGRGEDRGGHAAR
jgi:hypothetical protein